MHKRCHKDTKYPEQPADKKINKFANRTPAKKERVTPTKILLDVW